MISATATFDQASLDRARKVLGKYSGRPLEERLRRATTQAARLMVNPIKAASPRRTGALMSSVKARASRGQSAFGRTIVASVGPTARHRHLVIQPHRIVTPGGRDTGRMTTGNPFVDRATASHRDEAIRIVSEITFGP